MRDKLLNIGYYFGFIPVYWLFNAIKHRDQKKSFHYLQVLAINFLVFCSFVIFIICFSIHTFILRFYRDFALTIPLEISFYLLGGLLFICILIWLEGIVSAIIGRAPSISLYSRFTRIKSSLIITAFLHIFVILIMSVAIHSSSIAQTKVEEAEVFLLYDDMGYIPRWVFTLGFYRDSIIANNRWGNGSVAIVPLDKKTLEYALENGRFVFVSSHGVEGDIILQGGILYGPENVERANISASLQYVYLSGCDTGLKHDDWEKALTPANVKTFERLSTTFEHIYWLFFKGPDVIKSLH